MKGNDLRRAGESHRSGRNVAATPHRMPPGNRALRRRPRLVSTAFPQCLESKSKSLGTDGLR